ncbi:hypothetical protein KAW08_02220 [bacterium]|nr:hypothetical protein [bacterium]
MKEKRPNFERVKKALFCQEVPDRLPLFEHSISNQIKGAFLGESIVSGYPFKNWEKEVGFWVKAGYDFISVTPHMLKGKWVDKCEGPYVGTSIDVKFGDVERDTPGIFSVDDFNKYSWPIWEDVDYSMLNNWLTARIIIIFA